MLLSLLKLVVLLFAICGLAEGYADWKIWGERAPWRRKWLIGLVATAIYCFLPTPLNSRVTRLEEYWREGPAILRYRKTSERFN